MNQLLFGASLAQTSYCLNYFFDVVDVSSIDLMCNFRCHV